MTKKFVATISIILAFILLGMGLFTKMPVKEISCYGENGYHEYVGGDAYNIQIEASLRAGEITGAMAQRAIYISGSAIIFIISLILLIEEKKLPSSTQTVLTINKCDNETEREENKQ